MFLAYLVVGIGVGLLLTPQVMRLLARAEIVRPNFRGEIIPCGVGLVFMLAGVVGVGGLSLVSTKWELSTLSYLVGLCAVGCLGMLDDLLGNRDDTGLKGHFKKLSQGELTTGALKALGISFIALIIMTATDGYFSWLGLLRAMVIALSANALNSFDLRPGRACKAFFVIAAIVLIFGSTTMDQARFLWLMAGIAMAYFYWDIKAKAMMGDAGSNVLGFTLGYSLVTGAPSTAVVLSLILLVVFHFVTEKYSLTKIIAGNRLLNYFDMLGRDA